MREKKRKKKDNGIKPYLHHHQHYLLSTLVLVTHGKSFQSEISRAFSFLLELNIVSKCRQMNKNYCEIMKSREKYRKKKLNILSQNHRYK